MTAQPAAISTQADELTELAHSLEIAQKRHHTLDALLYNGGTVIVLLFTSAASLLPTINPDSHYQLTAQILAALAAFVVATERALNFGSRWRFHVEMDSAYSALLNMITIYRASAPFLPDTEKQKRLQEISQEVSVVSRREGGIPGSGTGGKP
jgi:hypothetical protein